jgi:hypothetical protein
MKSADTFSTLISVLKADIKEVLATKLEILRLEVLEKSSIASSFLIYGLVIANLVFFALLFTFIALGLLIGTWVNSPAGGFAIVTLIYILLLIILFAYRKPILTNLKNMFLKELDPDLADEELYEAKHIHKAQINEDIYESD